MARVVDIEGSGPRDPGAAMAVNDEGEVAGSVSGGCVEGAVVGEALGILDGARGPGVVTFGYSDDEAFAVGLACGGRIRVLVEPVRDDDLSPALLKKLVEARAERRQIAYVVDLETWERRLDMPPDHA